MKKTFMVTAKTHSYLDLIVGFFLV